MTQILDSPLWLVSLVLFVRPMVFGITAALIGRKMKSPTAPQSHRAANYALMFGAVCILISVLVFVFASADMSPVLIGFAVGVQGCGLGIWNPLSMTIIAARVPDEHLSAVSAVTSLAMSLSQTVGMAVFLAVCQLCGGTSAVVAYQATFGVMACCAIVGVCSTIRTCLLLSRNLPVVWKSDSVEADLPSAVPE